jgi:hypothetical protein
MREVASERSGGQVPARVASSLVVLAQVLGGADGGVVPPRYGRDGVVVLLAVAVAR